LRQRRIFEMYTEMEDNKIYWAYNYTKKEKCYLGKNPFPRVDSYRQFRSCLRWNLSDNIEIRGEEEFSRQASSFGDANGVNPEEFKMWASLLFNLEAPPSEIADDIAKLNTENKSATRIQFFTDYVVEEFGLKISSHKLFVMFMRDYDKKHAPLKTLSRFDGDLTAASAKSFPVMNPLESPDYDKKHDPLKTLNRFDGDLASAKSYPVMNPSESPVSTAETICSGCRGYAPWVCVSESFTGRPCVQMSNVDRLFKLGVTEVPVAVFIADVRKHFNEIAKVALGGAQAGITTVLPLINSWLDKAEKRAMSVVPALPDVAIPISIRKQFNDIAKEELNGNPAAAHFIPLFNTWLDQAEKMVTGDK